MRPHSVRQIGVRAGDADRHGAHNAIDTLERVKSLLVQLTVHDSDQEVADLEQVGGAESPLLITAHQERMLERSFDAAVDQEEAAVLAEAHLGHARVTKRRALEPPRREPLVLRAECGVGLKTGHRERSNHVSWRE